MTDDGAQVSRVVTRDQSRPKLRELADIVGRNCLADDVLGASSAPDAWEAITSTVDGIPYQNAAVANPSKATLVENIPARSGSDVVDLQADGSITDPAFVLQESDSAVFAQDKTLKTDVRISSKAPLSWTREVRQALTHTAIGYACSAGTSSSVLQWPLMGGATTFNDIPADAPSASHVFPNVSVAAEEGQFRFVTSLINFRHPSAPLMSVVSSQWQALFSTKAIASGVATSKVGSEIQSTAIARLEAWHTAFRSLFYGYRYRQVREFYTIMSSTAILFTTCRPDTEHCRNQLPGKEVCDDLVALISRGTRGLITILEENNIEYTLHAKISGPSKGVADGTHRLANFDADDCDFVSLSVHGAVNIHALFNFLLESGPKLGNATDVPTLISDSPFVEGKLTSCVVQCPRVMRTEDNLETYDVHIKGMFTPLQFSRICQAMQQLQTAGFSIGARSDHCCIGLNEAATFWSRNEEGGNQDPQERRLGSRIIRRVVVNASERAMKVYTKPEAENYASDCPTF